MPLRAKSELSFDGESGEEIELDLESSAIRCCIICSNFSMNRSLVSLAWRMCFSNVESRGISERSIELTASYNEANVSGNGDLKYSSKANNRRGWYIRQSIARDHVHRLIDLLCRYGGKSVECKWP